MGLTVLVGGVIMTGFAGQASAATVSVRSPHRLAFVAGAGETNNVTVTATGTSVKVTDAGAPLVVDPTFGGCTVDPALPNEASCADVERISATLGDMDDEFHNNTALPSYLRGETGNDRLYGGDGSDVLLGEADRDSLYGGAGDDTINSFGGAVDVVDCGPGQDTVKYDALVDEISASCEIPPGTTPPPPPGSGQAPAPPVFRGTPAAVIVPSKPGTPDPIKVSLPTGACPTQFVGAAGGDRIDGTGVGDRMFGMAGNDILNGLGGADCLFGMDGNDGLYGGEGSDRLYGGAGRDLLFGGPSADRLWGGKGDDKLSGDAGSDLLSGGKGNDRMSGGKGNDVLKGGSGRNKYYGGSGRDTILARNHKRDVVRCGSGRDTARVDAVDSVKGCEKVIVKR